MESAKLCCGSHLAAELKLQDWRGRQQCATPKEFSSLRQSLVRIPPPWLLTKKKSMRPEEIRLCGAAALFQFPPNPRSYRFGRTYSPDLINLNVWVLPCPPRRPASAVPTTYGSVSVGSSLPIEPSRSRWVARVQMVALGCDANSAIRRERFSGGISFGGLFACRFRAGSRSPRPKCSKCSAHFFPRPVMACGVRSLGELRLGRRRLAV